MDGVNVDAVAAAVRGCPGVSGLFAGRFGEVGTYLPGRRVPGIQIADDTVTVHVRGRWGVPGAQLHQQITGAVVALIAPRIVHLVLADVDDPPDSAPVPPPSALTSAAPVTAARPRPVFPPPGA